MAANTVTPMMAQFLEIKEEYPTALLFYRMGDFYELFFDDAVAAADALDIALTKRGKHLGEDIPMCGVPVHSAEGYLLNLIRKGFRVAVCEQLESPAEAKKRGSKSVVKRGVVRLVTPGTLSEDSLLSPKQNNFLSAYSNVRGDACLAWADMSTGDVFFIDCNPVVLGPELARIAPSEILISDTLDPELIGVIDESGTARTELFPAAFDSEMAKSRLLDAYQVSSLDGFGTFERHHLSALGALVEYLSMTQKGQMPLLRRPQKESRSAVVMIDAATRRNLEISRTLSGDIKGSLIHTIDRTVSAMGGRLFHNRMTTPHQNLERLNQQLSQVESLSQNSGLRHDLRLALKQCPDLERALSRTSLGRSGPRDLKAVENALVQAQDIRTLLAQNDGPFMNGHENLTGFSKLSKTLNDIINDDPPLLARDGGFVRQGFDAELDELRRLRDETRAVIAGLQSNYVDTSSVTALKIKHNNVLGYFIETPATHAKKMLDVPLNETFIHRQTTANSVRFTTVELGELETKIINAAQTVAEIEASIFDTVVQEVLNNAADLHNCARAIAQVDVATALAEIAMEHDWCKPVLSSSKCLTVQGGRHPVVEAALNANDQNFVANACDLNAQDGFIWLLTGPNMAGKSTFLRQNALIALLAQCGSFVPATSAEIGLVSQIFSRVGASDDLARGQSTFMVEMVETAMILNQADDRALVILDEIGRGTSTYDGLSIAWATLEHLHEVNACRALFATHYHELTQLADTLEQVDNATVLVREWDGEVVFLHEVRKGTADRSYGVQVAKLAGLPTSVLDRAKAVLESLENNQAAGPTKIVDDLPLFSTQPVAAPKVSDVEESLKDINPDMLSPREALDVLYKLKSQLTD